MSSDADAAAALVDLYSSFVAEGYCTVAAAVLFIYETFVTFDREVTCFWTGTKRTGGSLLFFANKWISITIYASSLAVLAPFSSDRVCACFECCDESTTNGVRSCALYRNAVSGVLALQLLPWAAFSALRAYVLTRSKLLGVFIVVLSLVPVGANFAKYDFQLSGKLVPPFGCVQTDNVTSAMSIRFVFVIISRVPSIAADILLIYVTWAKLSSRDTLRSIQQSKRLTLQDILFRNGTIYFLSMFILNVLHLALTVAAVAVTDDNASYVTAFTNPLTAILVSRFLLELQEADRMLVRLDPDDPLHSSRNPYDDTPSFISSLGAFINPDLPAAASDDNHELHVSSRSDGKDEGVNQDAQDAPSSSSA